ncbi:MAG: hypothetical protein HZA79_16285 [Sphingobacteriales bacterium]|nr:hypothetical protein [Sphingobacteriales bacterium]
MNQIAPASCYSQRVKTISTTLVTLKKKATLLSWLRLFSFLGAVLLAWLLRKSGAGWAVAGFISGMISFFYFVNRDLDNKAVIENLSRLLQICRDELLALDHHFHHFPDGAEYLPSLHPYAADLDLFGKASLFQYINRTKSEQAGLLLAGWLLEPASQTEIISRQKAVGELAAIPEWNQQLQSYGAAKPITVAAEKNISNWLQEPNRLLHKKAWILLRFLFPAASLSSLALYLTGTISPAQFLTLATVFLAIALLITQRLMPAWIKLGKISAELESFADSIRHIESAAFTGERLNKHKASFNSNGPKKASAQIAALKKIMDRLDYRLNPVVFIPLSIFLCWDLQQVFSLEKWKEENREGIRDWFESLAAIEALSTLGTLSFNHPQWVFPVIETGTVFGGKELGHPLIPEGKRVCNSFHTTGKGVINLVTGSNMAGKSTFLRSCGINIVLAMAGAAVCARGLRLSPMKVMSSMRVSDNLEESTSTFYAELKKLKTIIEAVNRKEPVFLLLDEILRGTNSADRHTGSTALIRQLLAQGAVGLVATHDLELANLKEEYPEQLFNYHFDVQISGEELYFDYILKEGICRSMNASLLMKKIGIEM